MVTTKRCAFGTCKNDSRYPESWKRNPNGDPMKYFHFPGAVRQNERRQKSPHICSLHFVGVKWGWQAYTIPTVRGICTFAVFFSVTRLCRLTLVYDRHFVLCCKEKLESLDRVYRAMANFKRSWVCMMSDFRCYLHVASLFWLISIARHVFFKSLAFLRDKIWRLLWTCCLLAFFFVTPGPAVIRTVYKSSLSRVSYLPSYVFLRRRRSITSRKHSCLEKSLCFSCTIWSSLCF